MTAQEHRLARFVSLRAIIIGLVIALLPANVWPPLLLRAGVPLAAIIEIAFLGLYVWWASGGGLPRRTQAARSLAFRSRVLSPAQWFWTIVAALSFATIIHG